MLQTCYTVKIRPSRQLEEAQSLEDDWTGKSSAKERRRKAAEKGPVTLKRHNFQFQTFKTRGPTDPHLDLAFAEATAALLPQAPLLRTKGEGSPTDLLNIEQKSPGYSENDSTPVSPSTDNANPISKPYPPPYLGVHFPLSSDHRLLTLIQYNVIRALLTNVFLASNIQEVPAECISSLPFILPGPSVLPATFTPTALQLSITHPYWIDSVPCPQLRDNLITAIVTEDERFDSDKMCDDMCGGFYNGFDDCEMRGILVWGEPWDLWSWELTEGFLNKWGWLLRGCTEMINASDLWRERRGEEPLVVEIE